MVRVVALSILALVLFALPASAQTMRLDDGTFGYKVVVYDKDGTEGSGVGGGDASASNQDEQTALLTTIDSSLEIIDNVVFGAGTAAAALRTTLASDDPAVALLTTSDASLTSIVSNTDRTADNLDTLLGSLAEDSVHGNAAVASGPQSLGEAKDIDGGALPNVVTEGQAVRAAFTLSGATMTTLVNEAGTADIGATMNTALASILTAVQLIDNAETPASHYAYTSAGSTEDEHVVVAAPATLWTITATNTAATVAYLRCEDQDQLADGAPGTDTLAAATDLDLAIPGATTGSGITFDFPRGATFTVGIKCWITTGEAYASVAEVGADDVKLFYSYK
jgi:hypothetical protein